MSVFDVLFRGMEAFKFEIFGEKKLSEGREAFCARDIIEGNADAQMEQQLELDDQ